MYPITLILLWATTTLNSNALKFESSKKRIKIYEYYDPIKGFKYERFKRTYLNDSIFYEYKLEFNKDETNNINVIDTFKVVNEKWYYLLNNKFNVFFDKDVFFKKTAIIKRYQENFDSKVVGEEPCISFIPLDTVSLNNKLLYISNVQFNSCSARTPDREFNPLNYYFDPTCGFVIQKSKHFSRQMRVLEYW